MVAEMALTDTSSKMKSNSLVLYMVIKLINFN